jgi:predicted nucleotidyltransferase
VSVATLVDRVAKVPGVVAMTLGGSRARGAARPDSDWDFGLYYRGSKQSVDVDAIRALGYEGHVVAPGAWGRLVNGGAWLQVDKDRVDLLYRDLDLVEHWLAETESGRFEVDEVAGHVAGLPTYVLAGELALGTVLRGALPRPTFPATLRRSAPPWWEGHAAFALVVAEGFARAGDATACAGLLARAVMAAAHSRLASHGTWVLNEKDLIARAGLDEAGEILAAVGWTPRRLAASVAEIRRILRLEPPTSLHFDAVRA